MFTVRNQRVLTGMRTSSEEGLHLGHYVGALTQWKAQQDNNEYECFYLLADMQALTTHPGDPKALRESIRVTALDWLSVGLDPTLPHVHFVQQSMVPERHALAVLLMQVTRYKVLMRNKTLQEELAGQADASVGFMVYPVDQAADILMVCPPFGVSDPRLLVPVGRDQESHLELQRDIARAFNTMYGNILLPCVALFPEGESAGRLVGTDGSGKMSKSKGNAIYLSDSTEVVRQKVMGMYTDPRKLAVSDNVPDTNDHPVFIYHRLFNPDQGWVEQASEDYCTGKIGDVPIKKKLIPVLNDLLDPIRAERARHEALIRKRPQYLGEIVMRGTEVAGKETKRVVNEMQEAMGIAYPNLRKKR